MLRQFLSLFFLSSLLGQVDYAIQTNSNSYAVGETIEMTSTVHNLGLKMVQLNWSSGCQSAYYIGNWSSRTSRACTLAHTWVDLEADSTHHWEMTHLASDTVFPAGCYPVVGFLEDDEYRLTPPQFITIGDTTIPNHMTGHYPPTDTLLATNGGCMSLVLMPEVEQVSDDLDLIWIRTDGYTWFQFPVEWYDNGYSAIQMSNEFYFYVHDSLDFTYELQLLSEFEDFTLNFDEENYIWAEDSCTFRLILFQDSIAVDTLDYHFRSELAMSIDDPATLPVVFDISAYPTPFNSTTTISYELSTQTDIDIKVYDITGRLVWSQKEFSQKPGSHKMTWQGTDTHGNDVSSGVYIVQVGNQQAQVSLKVTLLK